LTSGGSVRDVVVVGGGHNGLVAACYLAREGFDVELVERDVVLGGAVSTVERWPGVRVDRGSSIHVMVRHTGIIEDLRLGELGLEYDDVDPFMVVPHPDRPIRLETDLAATCASIASACSPADASAYCALVAQWTPRMSWFLDAAARAPRPSRLGRSAIGLVRAETGSRAEMIRDFLEPAAALSARLFRDQLLRGALEWWAAQSGPPPHAVGTAPMLGTIAMLHSRPAGRPRGGSGRLSDALAERFAAFGGSMRVGDAATAITTRDGLRRVTTASGAEIRTRSVLAGCHIAETMRLLDDDAARAHVRIGRGLGMVVRLLTDRLPAYRVEIDGMHTAMQMLVDSPEQIRAAYADFLTGRPSSDPPLIVMTPTATDPTLAPGGHHVVSVWAQWHPHELRDGDWDQRRDAVANTIIDGVERWAPGFTSSIVDRHVQTPLDLERELGLLGGNVMHVEPELDAMFTLRPVPGWAGYRTPHAWVYVCGASTHPGGGVWGASGRAAARVVGRDLKKRRPRIR
jgi:phytoene dehydrogenase-like protein